jgi:nucleoside phosphorylase
VGRALRVAAAVAVDMGATAGIHALLPLVELLRPRCIAMCGVCAGRPGKTQLGDVVAADRVYYHDTGKQRRGRVQQDLKTYNLRDDWKAALDGMSQEIVARFRREQWFKTRPLTTEARLHRALIALRDGVARPWKAIDRVPDAADEWPLIVAALRERRYLAASSHRLTTARRRFVEDFLFRYRGMVPDLSPAGRVQPFRLHVAPIGSGMRVIEDERIWGFVSQAMRKTLSLEMEAAVIGEFAHRDRDSARCRRREPRRARLPRLRHQPEAAGPVPRPAHGRRRQGRPTRRLRAGRLAAHRPAVLPAGARR